MRYLSSAISASGGTETTDGSYTVNKFTSSGTFTISSGSGDVQYLIIGGGGSGGSSSSSGAGMGGGGAGGVLQGSLSGMGVGSHSVVVGTGGAQTTHGTSNHNPPNQCADANYSTGKKGTSSTFNGLEAYGGGAGYGTAQMTNCGAELTDWNPNVWSIDDIRDGGSGGGGGFDSNGGTLQFREGGAGKTITTSTVILDESYRGNDATPNGSAKATFEDDFSSDGWTDTGSGVSVTGDKLNWNNVAMGADNRASRAIGSTLSDTTWLMRFEFNTSAYLSLIHI